MAQATLVEMHIKEGQRLIDRLTKEGVAVTAAAWVKESESGDWYLYLATPLVTVEGGKRPAYHRVNEAIRELQKEGFGMDPFAKKVIGPHDPIAADLVANRDGVPGELARGSGCRRSLYLLAAVHAIDRPDSARRRAFSALFRRESESASTPPVLASDQEKTRSSPPC